MESYSSLFPQIDRTSDQCCARLAGIEAFDYFLAARTLAMLVSASHPYVSVIFHVLLAASAAPRLGHTTLPLASLGDITLWADPEKPGTGYRFPSTDVLHDAMSSVDFSPGAELPFVADKGCIYLRRYWQFEVEAAESLAARLSVTPLDGAQQALASQMLDQLFPTSSDDVDMQRAAVANSLGRRLMLLCGGPGTGKTYTVARLLVVAQALAQNALKIRLAAPTGKAAQRLGEALDAAKASLADAGVDATVLAAIPSRAETVHRMLGIRPDSSTPSHHEKNPLDCDLLLIDEVSMMDLPLMARVLRALPAHCRLLLLGDADQLPSVETGSVLAELAPRPHGGFSEATRSAVLAMSGQTLPAGTGLHDHVIFLTKSRRFGGVIGQLAQQVIAGDGQGSGALLRAQSTPANAALFRAGALTWTHEPEADAWFETLSKHHYGQLHAAADLMGAFAALNAFRFLVPTRIGDRGVEQLNERVETLLAKSFGHVRACGHYRGRPVMVIENCYSAGLFNGDVGLIWPDAEGRLCAWFERGPGDYRRVSLARLPRVETVYAMTIHKTQGSEFDSVAILLPAAESQMLGREILYTGLTRAKQRLHIACTLDIWQKAVVSRVSRHSTLGARLVG